jgi:Predicted integral membrane protein
MNNFFNPDNAVMVFLGKLFDVFVLSIIWLIVSLPIITIGASTTALYYSCVKAIRRERGYVLREFWHSFKTNFVNATILWIPYVLLSIIFVINIRFSVNLHSNMGFALLCIYSMLAFVLLSTGMYVFPVLSRFTLTRKQVLKTSFFMSLKHFPITLLLIIIVAATTLGLYIMPPLAFFLPATSTIIFSFLMERILKKYTPKADEEEQKDEWYLE